MLENLTQNYASFPSLKGRSVFISGGASGIGESLVRHFCAQGSSVAFVDIAEDAGHALVKSIGDCGSSAPLFLPCDLRDVQSLQAAIATAGDTNGPVEVLCNNAGNDDRHRTQDVDVSYWDDRMAVNVRHQFFAAQAVLPHMRAQGKGSIINFGSITWMVGDADCPAYVTSKAAIYGMTRALAREFGPHNIRVNCLVPGWVMTERQMKLWLNAEGEKQIGERQCLPSRLMPSDIARMALFLAADDSAMCTSQQFIVDGGWV